MRVDVTIVDFGIGNLRSVQKAIEFVGGTATLSADPDAIHAARRLILPGVGAFGAGMLALRERGLDQPVREAAADGVPLLGICLGMQLLFTKSEEMGLYAGLDLLPGKVVRFPEQGLKVPHMGWNQIEPAHPHMLLEGVNAGQHAYFVHSYYCEPVDSGSVLAWSEYGLPFAAIVARENVMGIQFHPEKSQQVGLRILKNFVTGM